MPGLLAALEAAGALRAAKVGGRCEDQPRSRSVDSHRDFEHIGKGSPPNKPSKIVRGLGYTEDYALLKARWDIRWMFPNFSPTLNLKRRPS